MKHCKSCRFWSEAIAFVEDGITKALCLNAGSPRASTYTGGNGSCDQHQSGMPTDLDALPPGQRATSEAYRDRLAEEDGANV